MSRVTIEMAQINLMNWNDIWNFIKKKLVQFQTIAYSRLFTKFPYMYINIYIFYSKGVYSSEIHYREKKSKIERYRGNIQIYAPIRVGETRGEEVIVNFCRYQKDIFDV